MFLFDTINKENLKRKKPMNRWEPELVNKFYIHRGAIYQIVRFHTIGFSGVEVFFQKPSGAYSTKTTTAHAFNKRGVFNTFDEAADYLLNTWVTENKLPYRRKEYIDELREYFEKNNKEYYGICSFC